MAAKYPQLGDDKNFLLLTGELLFQPKGQTGYINLGPLTMHQITPTTEKKTVVRSLRFNQKRTVREDGEVGTELVVALCLAVLPRPKPIRHLAFLA